MTKKQEFKIDFVSKVNLFGGLSVLFVIASIVYLAVRGISWGIDFKGGTEVQVKFAQETSINEVRATADSVGLKDLGVQSFGEDNEYVIRFQAVTGKTDKETNENLNKAIASVRSAIETKFADRGVDIRRVDSVGPQVGAELKRNGFLATFYSLLIILVYIGLRFDYKYSPGAVICLFHDAIITLAIFVLSGKDVNIPILAAIMTLIGYSLNDTIVVFDRMRETEQAHHGKDVKFIINKSINDMLSRTLITGGTTLFSSMALWFLADGTVSDIAFALSIGVIFGTYSSIYVAAPTVLLFEKLKARKA